ncbi:MAG: SMP-30/gluconolactonase/LRE family protein [Pseudomonadota bacterium]
MKLLKLILIVVVAIGLYLTLWPVPVDPKAWDAPKAPERAGKYAVNDALANFETIELDGLHGPEAITSNAAGDIYATTHEGWIIRWRNGASKPERWVDAGGRPLGIAFDAQQNLWVANAYSGLQKVDVDGNISVETNMAEGVAIRYADDLVVTPNGKVYFSDASTKFAAEDANGTLEASLLDILEHGGHGRIIEFDPASKESRVIMDGLNFANGVTANEAGDFILVAETGGYQVWKYWLQGARAGQSEVIIDNLPGFPDNVHLGQNGRYWIGLTSPRSDVLDDLSGKPMQRKMVQRLPAFMRPQVEAYGHVLAIDETGEVLVDYQDPKGAYPATTGAWETDDFLYVSSLTAPIMARYKKSDLGLQ